MTQQSGSVGLQMIAIGTPNSPVSVQPMGPNQGILNSATGTAKRLDAIGNPVPLGGIKVIVKMYEAQGAEPAAPTDAEWASATGVQVVYDINTYTHHWTAPSCAVRTAFTGDNNKIWARATWAPGMSYPPVPPTPEIDSRKFRAVASSRLELSVCGEASELAIGPVFVVAAPTVVDLLPTCVDGDWILYQGVPANLLKDGGRLMLNPITPLRVGVLGVAATNVNWELNANGARLLGFRRPCGSNFYPAPIGMFPFVGLPIWSLVVSQVAHLNPFVVMSDSRCHADQVVLDSAQDVRVRLNVPDDYGLLIAGSYDLWVNPHIGFPRATCGSCSSESK